MIHWLYKHIRRFYFFKDSITQSTYHCPVHEEYTSQCKDCINIMNQALDKWWSIHD